MSKEVCTGSRNFSGKMGKRAEVASPLCLVGQTPAAGIPFLNGLVQGLESTLNSQNKDFTNWCKFLHLSVSEGVEYGNSSQQCFYLTASKKRFLLWD